MLVRSINRKQSFLNNCVPKPEFGDEDEKWLNCEILVFLKKTGVYAYLILTGFGTLSVGETPGFMKPRGLFGEFMHP